MISTSRSQRAYRKDLLSQNLANKACVWTLKLLSFSSCLQFLSCQQKFVERMFGYCYVKRKQPVLITYFSTSMYNYNYNVTNIIQVIFRKIIPLKVFALIFFLLCFDRFLTCNIYDQVQIKHGTVLSNFQLIISSLANRARDIPLYKSSNYPLRYSGTPWADDKGTAMPLPAVQQLPLGATTGSESWSHLL